MMIKLDSRGFQCYNHGPNVETFFVCDVSAKLFTNILTLGFCLPKQMELETRMMSKNTKGTLRMDVQTVSENKSKRSIEYDVK